jgi:hypothetical protein
MKESFKGRPFNSQRKPLTNMIYSKLFEGRHILIVIYDTSGLACSRSILKYTKVVPL